LTVCWAGLPGRKLRRARRAALRGQTCCRAAQARAATRAAFAAVPGWASCRGCWTPSVFQSRSAKCSALVSTIAASRPSSSISNPTRRFAAQPRRACACAKDAVVYGVGVPSRECLHRHAVIRRQGAVSRPLGSRPADARQSVCSLFAMARRRSPPESTPNGFNHRHDDAPVSLAVVTKR
jgi:hypothetical protein